MLRDVRNELLSREKAEADYGVVIDVQSWLVHERATEQRRAQIRAGRAWREVPKVQWTEPLVQLAPSAPAHAPEPALSK